MTMSPDNSLPATRDGALNSAIAEDVIKPRVPDLTSEVIRQVIF